MTPRRVLFETEVMGVYQERPSGGQCFRGALSFRKHSVEIAWTVAKAAAIARAKMVSADHVQAAAPEVG